MKDKDIVVGRKYRVKKGLHAYCWNDINLPKSSWEGIMIEVVAEHDNTRELVFPDGKYGVCSVWSVRRDGMPVRNWLPAYALESICMFA